MKKKAGDELTGLFRFGTVPSLQDTRPAGLPDLCEDGLTMTLPNDRKTQVLICGAGPTGLMLAGQLAAQGVRCRIIDKAPERSPHSRALVVQPRTLELLDGMGLAEELIAAGQPTPEVVAYVNQQKIANLNIRDTGIADTPFPFLLFVSQVETERVLERYLHEHKVQVERPVELLSFTKDPAGVTALLQHGTGQQESVRADYLVGCDGAHSVVRKGLGLHFEGEAYAQDFVLADVDIRWAVGHDQLTVSLSDDGTFVVFPMKGENAYRIIAARAQGPEATGDPTLAEMQALADARSPVPMKLSAPRWLARFRLHHRAVDRSRVGRCLVAGDAAHIHSPAGGQGMNTGIQDAANLAWKLALVLRGAATESLLQTYHDERWPVGQALLQTTDRMFSMSTIHNRLLIGMRNLLVRPLAGSVLAIRPLRARIFRFIGQLGIAYPHSPIVAEDLHGASSTFRHAAGKGQRAPFVPRGGESLRARLRGAKHHLLVFTGAARSLDLQALQRQLEAALGPGLGEVVMIWRGDGIGPVRSLHDDSGVLHKSFGITDSGMYLLRPDGYIAFRTAQLDPAPLRAYRQRIYPAS